MSFGNTAGLVSQALTMLQGVDPDAGGVPPETVQAQIGAALTWICRFQPATIRYAIDGDGINYQFAIPATWIPGVSRFLALEYPNGQRTRVYVEIAPRNGVRQVELYPNAGAPTHFHFAFIPASGTDNLGLDFTGLYTVTDSGTTVPESLQPVVEHLLGAVVAKVHAAKMGYLLDPQIEGAAAQFSGKGAEWANIAKACTDTASDVFGADLTARTWAGSTRIGTRI